MIWADLHRTGASRVIYANPPDHHEMLTWRNDLRPGDLFVDVGANVGSYAIWAAELGAEVIALEPADDTFALLEENVALNGYPIKTIRAAAGATLGTARFTIGRDCVNALDPDGIAEIEVVTIDSIIGNRTIAGMKVDVEGFEIDVLRGCEQALSEHRVRLIQLEWNSTDLRALTRTRARLAQDQARHQARVEKILEDALLKISVVISDLFGASGRRFLDALVAGERSPAALAALGDKRLRATRAELAQALTGRFRDIHAFEISVHLRLIDAICAEITALDEQTGQQLALVPGTAPACAACGLAGGGHAAGCADEDVPVLDLATRLEEITGVGAINGRAIIAELGTGPSQFPTPGHAAG